MPSTIPGRITRILLAGAAALLLVGCGDDGGEGTTPSTSPTSSSPSTTVSGVYFMVDTRTGFRLAREFRDLAGDDPAVAAVETMIAGADDPDYATAWNPETQVLGVTQDGSAIEVDLSADARTANIGSEGAALMIQQLVYTVTEAVDEEATVQLLIEGEPAGELWGVVSWDEPVGRADPLDVRSLVQIDAPREGVTTTSPLRIEGEAAVFEATLSWRILGADGTEVNAGITMTAEGQTFAPFMFPVVLEPGTYTVEISEDDPSGGEGGPVMTDTRTVTIE
jgi:hypothetical protein